MKVLVTGATGFVGTALLAEFRGRGFEAVAVGGPSGDGATYSIDVADGAAAKELDELKRVDAVVHAAGIAHRFGKTSDFEFRRVNVDGVRNIAELAVRLGAKHFVLLSSTLVYGRGASTVPITESAECRPIDAYAKSKLDGEAAAREVCGPANMNLTIFRPAPIVGEGSKGNFARLIRAIDTGKFLWVGKGENLKSVVYVGDVAKAAAVALENGGDSTQVFNLAADAVTMKDMVETIAAKLGRKVPAFHIPDGPVSLVAKMSPRMSRMLDTWLGDDVYSNSALLEAYGYKPETPADTAIGREVEYYLKHK